ncbi:hypothetical protein DBADOPDK_02711 [Pseudomonas sp. MM223]|nr:hypothetical protein DBADOPDK_02711 [Pseudomonas sp. MM223]
MRRLQAGALGDVVTEHVRGLVGQPDVQGAVRVEAGEGGRWFKLGMVQVLVVVAGFDLGFGIAQGAGDIAFVFFITGRALDRGQMLAPGVAGKIGRHRSHLAVDGRLFPVHLNCLYRTLCVPPALGHHRHGARQLMHRMYAFHGLDLVFVAQAANRHAQAGRMLHSGVEHAVDLYVDAVLCLAGGFVVSIQAAYGLADPAKLAGVTQLDAGGVGYRQVHGAPGEFTVGDRAPGRGMYYVTWCGREFIDRHTQLFGARLRQHGPGKGTQAAHGRVAHAHRHAATGDAHAVFHHDIGFAGWCAIDHEIHGVDIQLFTHNLCHGGERALPTFHEGAEQAHRAVWANLQKRWHLGAALCSCRGGGLHAGRAHGQAETQHQGTDRGAGKKAPTRQVDGFAQLQLEQFCRGIDWRVHQACSPWARPCTAAWMAL